MAVGCAEAHSRFGTGLHRFVCFSPLQFYLRNDIFFIVVEVLLLRRIFMCPLMLKIQCEMRQNGAVVLYGIMTKEFCAVSYA